MASLKRGLEGRIARLSSAKRMRPETDPWLRGIEQPT